MTVSVVALVAMGVLSVGLPTGSLTLQAISMEHIVRHGGEDTRIKQVYGCLVWISPLSVLGAT
jgi:hypothetical protein